jgi:hypothetical protein
MSDQSTTRFLTGMLRRGARPMAQIGPGLGTSLARTTSAAPEDFSLRPPRAEHTVHFDESQDFHLRRRMESFPSPRREGHAEADSLEKSHLNFPKADATAVDSDSPMTESLSEKAVFEAAAPDLAPSLAPEAGTAFHSTRRERQRHSGGMDKEVERVFPDLVESLPDSFNEVSSPLSSAHGEEYGTGRSLLLNPREAVPPASLELRRPPREFRIIEPALPARPVQSGGLDGLAGSASGKESNQSPSQSERTPSRGEARFQSATTTVFEENRESPGPGEAQTSHISIESTFESGRREAPKTEARRREFYSAPADEISPKESRRRHGGQFHQERGARVTINRLDIQIINQQPPAPPQAAPRASASATDAQYGVDRQLLGRFDLSR